MSLAFGKKAIIIMEEGSDPPSGLKWTDRIEYKSYKHLEESLVEKLPKALGIK